ncbi:MAG: HPr family phosphocarrier protein [Gemmatimonadota bacterium]|nr:HPr family phosphocarrier protein [Gemmatimonadota bacterium]
MSGDAVERSVQIVNRAGLHARPAAQLVKLASDFPCDIEIGKDRLTVNAKSIMGVLMLAAEHGSEVELRCSGERAGEALDALTRLIASGFEEEA